MKSVFELLKSCCEALEKCLTFDFINKGDVVMISEKEAGLFSSRFC